MKNLKTLKKSQLLNYIIDCLGYGEEECKNSSKYDLIEIVEDIDAQQDCLAFNN